MMISKVSSVRFKSIVYMLSSLVTFILAFLINVILTNYSANGEVFGQYKYATNFILTIPAIFSFGISWSCASLIAKDEEKNSQGIICVSIVYTVIIGIIVTLGLFLLHAVSLYLNKPMFEDVTIVFPFIVVFLLQILVNQIYTGLGQSFSLSLFNVAPNIILFLGMIGYIAIFGKLSYTFSILLYMVSYLLIIIPKIVRLKYSFYKFRENSKMLFKDIWASGLKVHISSIFTTSSTQIIALVCGNIYGYSEYGYYSLAASLSIIFQLIGSSVAVVNFKQYANIDKISKKDFVFMLILGVIAYISMCLIINKVFYLFYPKEYEPTIFYLKLLCLANLGYGFSALFNRFFIGKSMGGKVMKNSIITAIATVVIEIPMILVFEMQGLAIASIIISMVCLLSYVAEYKSYLNGCIKT